MSVYPVRRASPTRAIRSVRPPGAVLLGGDGVVAETTDTDGDGVVTPPTAVIFAKEKDKLTKEEIRAMLVEAGATVEVK